MVVQNRVRPTSRCFHAGQMAQLTVDTTENDGSLHARHATTLATRSDALIEDALDVDMV